MSKDCITSVESNNSSFGWIQFQDASGIDGEVSFPLYPDQSYPVVGPLVTDRRCEGAVSVHTQESRTYLRKQPELFKALAKLHSQLGLDCTAIGVKDERFLRKEINLSL